MYPRPTNHDGDSNMCIILAILILASGILHAQDFVSDALAARTRYQQQKPLVEAEWDAEKAKITDNKARGRLTGKYQTKLIAPIKDLYAKYPVECDWLLQDLPGTDWLAQNSETELIRQAIAKAAAEIGRSAEAVNAAELLAAAGKDGTDHAWLTLYCDYARERRRQRLAVLGDHAPLFAYIKRAPVTPSFFAYTEGQSDAQHERFFRPGSELCLLTITRDGSCSEETIIRDEQGMMRDPDVAFDASRILFSWKKSDRDDDYHLYEINLADRQVRQITHGLGVADFEGIYVPGDHIVFSSSRCVQTVDCWWTEVSNLYTCDLQGRYLRRLGFDQVHTVYPQLMDDGSVVYTRWDYNDRGQMFTQALFRMNTDGSAQTELYGNNSWFPTTPCHARQIPGTRKLLAVAMGHHTWQAGKLVCIDPLKGRQEAEGVDMLAPRAKAEAVRIDTYGQSGDLFRHPYPVSENDVVTAFIPALLNTSRGAQNFGIYYVHTDGRRELLAWNAWRSGNHPVAVQPRAVPPTRPSLIDYRQQDGTFYLQDIYYGPGLTGVARGEVKSLRVVALEFRAAGIRSNSSYGPGGRALVCTPVAINNGSWDVKRVLGTTPVYDDGSAFFKVPARTPVFFQALDAQGQVVQTMRSWSTLQPNEVFACIGCHENKNESMLPTRPRSIAGGKGPQALTPFSPEPRGFSYLKDIQPIWNQHCVSCHQAVTTQPPPRPTPSASYCYHGDTVNALCDDMLPDHSCDHSIRRMTWHPHRNCREWVQFDFPEPRSIDKARVYWFDDEPIKGACRPPTSWQLLYLDNADGQWRPVVTTEPFTVHKDRFNAVTFAAVTTRALRIDVQLQERFSSGVLEWQVAAPGEKYPDLTKIDLSATPVDDPQAGRRWTASYAALTHKGRSNKLVNWISSQSAPPMLPPRSGGSTQSGLLTLLRDGHRGVTLSARELDTIALWIDLAVPFCGDYREANLWNDQEMAKYDHYERKRHRLAALERTHLEAFIRRQTGATYRLPTGYSNLAVNPYAKSEPTSFPQASSNSCCRNDDAFHPANAIDGRSENKGHGHAFPSWGPEQIADPWLKIDFGEEVEIDCVDIWLRADFPHDDAWSAAVIECSDGSTLPIQLAKTADRQSFPFPARRLTWLRLRDFTPSVPKAWRAISEIEAWGRRLQDSRNTANTNPPATSAPAGAH